ncbi:hypothetical protein RKE29_27460 [Streptomyces sp. B1866]|uniref:hypothetical protein n=1 Tax=Streptomyces sp. B1866 TaxID=3075431 RepID=UPI002891CB9E|nr:hypothetical protein [Streptomyces sp. B1866]MDT3400305.1 hypothetical protein [Streptomyces sp. B1866]
MKRVFGRRTPGRHRIGGTPVPAPRATVTLTGTAGAWAAVASPKGAVPADTPTLSLPRLAPDPADDVFWPVDEPLVRAFVIAHERELAAREQAARAERAASRAERRAQRQRRRDAWLASYGIDTGPRRIHGVVVSR